MPLSAFGLILVAGLIHASWNIAAKKANEDARFAFQSGVFLKVLWAPPREGDRWLRLTGAAFIAAGVVALALALG